MTQNKPGTVSGSPLETLEQRRRVFPRATATGSAWVHAPPLERLETGGLALLPFLFPSLPVVTNTITCNHKQNRNNTVDFRFLFHCFQIRFPPSSPFRSVSFFLSSLFAVLSFFRWQIWWRRVAVWRKRGAFPVGAGSVGCCFVAVTCVWWSRYGEGRGCWFGGSVAGGLVRSVMAGVLLSFGRRRSWKVEACFCGGHRC